MSQTERLNPGLYGVHRIFFVLYVAIGIVFLLAIAFALFEGTRDADRSALGLLVFVVLLEIGVAVAHGYAAKGARLGLAYGRRLSRIIGILWLIGFPLGTLLGIYVLVKASDKHWRFGDPRGG